jgi:hypothetical protein
MVWEHANFGLAGWLDVLLHHNNKLNAVMV